MLNQSFAKIRDPTNDLLRWKLAIDHDCKIPLDRWKTWKRTGFYLSRSIFKQSLEVKFEDQKWRQSDFITDVRMDLPEIAQFAIIPLKRRRSPGMKKSRRLLRPC